MKRGTAELKAQRTWTHNNPESNNRDSEDNRRLKLFLCASARVRLERINKFMVAKLSFPPCGASAILHYTSSSFCLCSLIKWKEKLDEEGIFIHLSTSIFLLIFQFIYSNTSHSDNVKLKDRFHEKTKMDLQATVVIFNFISMVWFGLKTLFIED